MSQASLFAPAVKRPEAVIDSGRHGSIQYFFRPGTSDEKAIEEVLVRRSYRRVRDGFDVEEGERWLDLGANIGAFALYCKSRGAKSVCYEPDPGCFEVLKMNADGFELHRQAVTAQEDSFLPFWKGRAGEDHYRATALPQSVLPKHPEGDLPNVHGSFLRNQEFDGVKMDIEGSEGGLIDEWLLPRCEKLCMEYHLSRDSDAESLARRVRILESKFKETRVPKQVRMVIDGEERNTWFDPLIWCWGSR